MPGRLSVCTCCVGLTSANHPSFSSIASSPENQKYDLKGENAEEIPASSITVRGYRGCRVGRSSKSRYLQLREGYDNPRKTVDDVSSASSI